MATKTIKKLITEFRRMLKPLQNGEIGKYYNLLGLPSDTSLDLDSETNQKLQGILDLDIESIVEYEHLFKDIKDIVTSITTLSESGQRLFEAILYQYLDDYHPALLAFLKLFKIVENSDSTEITFKWGDLGNIFNPKVLAEELKWGENLDFNHASFLGALEEFSIGFNVPAGRKNLPYELAKKLYFPGAPEASVDPSAWESIRGLQIPVLFLPTEEGLIEAGIWVLPKPTVGNTPYEGLVIVPYGEFSQVQEVQLSETFRLLFDIGVSANSGLALTHEGANLAFLDGDFDFKIQLTQYQEGSRIYAIGTDTSSSLSYQKLTGEISGSEDDFGFGFSLDNGIVRVQAGEGDGFIQSILPKDPFEIEFDVEFGWSLKNGFYVNGGAKLDFSLPINKEFGPIFVNTIDLSLGFDGGANFGAGVSGGIEIGPVLATVGNMGLQAKLSEGEGGILGRLGFSLEFKPPSQVGVAIDAEGLKGGGFLDIDPPQYFGILNLAFEETFDLTVVGLISTELPGDPSGYSMLFSILMKLPQPIQLSFGFALNEVGGLVAIHHSMSETGLREVFKDHSLDAILFPESPIKDATRILNAIQNIFPQQKNRHSFGIMGLITWGGLIVEGSIGILVEIGGPGKLALIGQIRSELPDKESSLVLLNMDILGFIDFGKQFISLDSTIYNSRILVYSLSGDMALRLSYNSSHPDFALAIGGFYPGYRPKMEFPSLSRMLVSLSKSRAKIELRSYFALTTNSVQTGANLYAEANLGGGVKIKGNTGFDAIIQFTPFSFATKFYLYIGVKFHGASIASIDLNTTLTGPNPFHVYGYAKIGLLIGSVKVDFDETFGKKSLEPSTEVSPFSLLEEEAKNTQNIRFAQPDWSSQGVIMKEEAMDKKLLDPAGAIIFSQKSVPLELEMERFAYVSPPNNERYLDVSLGSSSGDSVKGKFAPAQFFNWSDKQKIEAPAFESFTNGKRWDGGAFVGADWKPILLNFETIIWDEIQPRIPKNINLLLDKTLKLSLYLQGASRRFKPDTPKANPKHKNYFTVKEETFVLTKDETIQGKFVSDSNPMTYAETQFLARKRGQQNARIRNENFTTKDSVDTLRRMRESRIPAMSMEG